MKPIIIVGHGKKVDAKYVQMIAEAIEKAFGEGGNTDCSTTLKPAKQNEA